MLTPCGGLQKKWDETEEKPAVIAITFFSFLVIWGLGGVVDAIDRLPLVSNFLELVGLIVTTWFAYRYLIFGPDRWVVPMSPDLLSFPSLLHPLCIFPDTSCLFATGVWFLKAHPCLFPYINGAPLLWNS